MTSDAELLAEATHLLEKRTPLALCTIIEKKGSGPRNVGAKMLVSDNGKTFGTIGGGAFERALIDECMKALSERKARTVRFNMTDEEGAGKVATGLICGGETAVFIDVLEADPRLIIVGSGHVALPLARIADIVGFDVTIVDDNAEQANDERFPMAKKIITDDFASAANQLDVRSDDVVVIAHGDHNYDYIALKALAEKRAGYLGLLGSKTKVAHLVKRLQSDCMSPERLDVLHAPVGIAIGAQTPEEIAISILAEVIQYTRTERPR